MIIRVDRGKVPAETVEEFVSLMRDRDACDPVLAEVLRNAARLELEPVAIEFYEIALADSLTG